MTTIAMLGLGSMNGAVLAGLLEAGVAAKDVVATSGSAESAQRRSQQYGVRVLAQEQHDDANTAAVADADVVFLGVKPPQTVALCRQIREAVKPGAVVVSVAAAITIEMMESALREGQPVIRTMPNTPLSVGAGMVGLAAGSQVSQAQTQVVAELLGASGSVHVVEEQQLDAFTGVAGSGPGYVFYLAEHMAAAGVQLGLSPEVAAEAAAQTIYGAGKMLVANRGRADAAQLRANVSSPNGTTQRAIETFEAHSMGDAIGAGVRASAARAAEITAELRG